MKTEYGVIHGIAECENCSWESSSYKNILAISKIHAEKHHHKVRGEVCSMFVYDGR
jgi:hypothetical protein